MRMLKPFTLLLFVGLIFSSCIEHEVIPAPETTVDLNAAFIGFVNGTQVEFTQNVNGYGAVAINAEDINPSPTPSHMTYGSKIKSIYNDQAIRVKFGTLDWDVSQNSYPTVSMFNDWLNTWSNTPVSFSDQGLSGMEIEYTDNLGVSWVSRESDLGQTGTFVIKKQESDNTGDYSLFECTFSCLVWRINPQTNLDESLNIENGKITSWFKK
tara:strand:- start:9585 stop:10217 length:633 start_codon:yes stop_codon:yes gene_type:complete